MRERGFTQVAQTTPTFFKVNTTKKQLNSRRNTFCIFVVKSKFCLALLQHSLHQTPVERMGILVKKNGDYLFPERPCHLLSLHQIWMPSFTPKDFNRIYKATIFREVFFYFSLILFIYLFFFCILVYFVLVFPFVFWSILCLSMIYIEAR